jgi:hypothetical protein
VPDGEHQPAGTGQSFSGSAAPLIRLAAKQLRREVETGSYKPKDNQLQRHLGDKITAARRITRL